MDTWMKWTHARLAAVAMLVIGSAALAQTPAGSPPPPPPATDEKPPGTTLELDMDKAGEPGAASSPWRFEIGLWLWLMGVDGDIGVQGRVVNVSETFADIVDESDSLMALAGRIEAGYGRIGGYVDGIYADITIEDQSGPAGLASVDIEFEQTIVDFGLMYRLFDWEPAGDAALNPRNITLDLYAGARYTDLDIQFRPALLPGLSGSEAWFDPVVGAKVVLPIGENWHLEINGDIGGFDVGSQFTWSATGVISYDFHIAKVPASVKAGYRAIAWDFTNGSGTDEFTWNVIQSGAFVVFSVQF